MNQIITFKYASNFAWMNININNNDKEKGGHQQKQKQNRKQKHFTLDGE